MIDLELFRARIGTFRNHCRTKRVPFNSFSTSKSREKCGRGMLSLIKTLLKICLIVVFLPCWHPQLEIVGEHLGVPPGDGGLHSHAGEVKLVAVLYQGPVRAEDQSFWVNRISEIGKKSSPNFIARYTYGNKEHPRGIKNIHLNIRSLTQKVSEVKNIVREHNPHVFGLSECELRKVNNIFDEKKLKIPGYDLLFPKSWSKYGTARVVVYLKKTLRYEQVPDLEDDQVQSVWLRGGFRNCKDIYFCHMYREHTSTLGSSIASQRNCLGKLLHQWEEATIHNNQADTNEVHVSGDMNLDILNGKWLWPSYNLITLSRLVQATCNTENFTQLVNAPTRYQFNSVKQSMEFSCIDHVYTNTRFRCSEVTVTTFGGSDHNIIGYIRYTKVPPSPARTIKKRSYKNFVLEDFLTEIRSIDWTDLYICRDVDVSAELFTRKFLQVLNSHAPWIQYQQRKHHAPWITSETKELIKKRDSIKKRFENHSIAGETEAAALAWKNFKQVRNLVNNRKKFEEKNFKTEKITKSLDSPAKMWSTAKSFMNWNKAGGPPVQLNIGGRLVTKAAVIAHEMNNFFIEKVKNVRNEIPFLTNTFSKCKERMQGKSCHFSLEHVSVKKVNKLLKGLKNSKSTAIDELDNFCVKAAADIIDKPLHYIITQSILQSRFPRSWRLAKVIPLHKKSCNLERKNYRPVSILSPLSKILEKVVYEQIYDYLTRNNIFHPDLHGYRQNRSTQTALLTMYDRWVKAAAAGQVSGAVLLDLSAAFDLVDPDLLIKKLRIYGLDKSSLDWVASYLDDRYQAVWLDHILSDFLRCDVGVPQGSNLGPLLFLAFFNDLPFELESSVDNYADDTTITATAPTVSEISDKLTADCGKVSRWMQSNKLKLNPDKTHILTLGTAERLRILPGPIQVSMDQVVLQEDPLKAELLLGCYIQSNLKWKKQVQYVIQKLRSRLVGLLGIRFIASFNIRKTITEGLFNSVLVYCLSLYGGMDNGDLGDLQVMQNKAARIVTMVPPRANRSQMYDKLGWLTINQLIFYHSVILVFKIRSSSQPEHLAQLLSQDSRNSRIIIPNLELRVTQRSFTMRGATSWNLLPPIVRNQPKLGTFKKLAKQWILANIERFPA